MFKHLTYRSEIDNFLTCKRFVLGGKSTDGRPSVGRHFASYWRFQA